MIPDPFAVAARAMLRWPITTNLLALAAFAFVMWAVWQ